MKIRIDWKAGGEQAWLADRGLEPGGRVQEVIDREVARRAARYAPQRTGALAHSAVAEGGRVFFAVPYARAQDKEGRPGAGLRGPRYVARMKAAEVREILRAAAKEAGGRR